MHAIDTYHPFTSHMHAHYLHMYTLHVHAHTIHMYMYTLHMHTAHTSHLPPTHSTRIRHICILYILHCTHTYHTCIHTYQLYHTALSHQPMHTPHITYYIHMHTDYTYLLRPHIHIQPIKLSGFLWQAALLFSYIIAPLLWTSPLLTTVPPILPSVCFTFNASGSWAQRELCVSFAEPFWKEVASTLPPPSQGVICWLIFMHH